MIKNKYTIKIKQFLDVNNLSSISPQIFSSLFAIKINEIFKSIKNIDIKTVQPVKLNKINTYDKPLLYIILSELKYPDEKILEYKYFLKWYRKNSTLINLNKIIPHNHKFYNLLFNSIDERKPLHEMLYVNRFIFLDAMYYSEKTNLIVNKYNNNNTNIILYHEDNGNNNFDIILTMKIIELFRKLTNKNMDVNLIILYYEQKRYFSENEKMVTPENINAGCTISGSYIYIWRKEEFYKVLIHELIHYFILDFWDFDDTVIKNQLNKVLNIKGNDVVNEAYTEIMALTINSIIYSNLNNISFNEIINYEIKFTHLQIAKIIKYFGGNEYNDLFTIPIYQSTSLSSYIIVKGMLLYNYTMILNHFDIYFNKNKKERFKNYADIYKIIINKNYKLKLNDNLINHYINLNYPQNKYITKSLKMVLFEL
jgi:hypothetical protein